MVIPKNWYSSESKIMRKCHLGVLSSTWGAHTTHVCKTIYEHMKILPKYMLFMPQGANIQRKSTFKKKKPNKKDWQKLNFPTPIWKNLNYEHKIPKNII